MGKYAAIFRVMWEMAVEYRFGLLSHMALGVLQFLVLIFLWSAIFRQLTSFGTYTLSSMITYLAMVRVFDFATRGATSRQIGEDIRLGQLSTHLLRPVNYLVWYLVYFLAQGAFEMLMGFGLFILFVFVLPQFMQLPSVANLFNFLLFIPVSLMVNFLINLLIAVMAFYVTDIRLIGGAIGLTINFFMGGLIPIDLLPGFMGTLGQGFPFRYMLYFPLRLYQGGAPPSGIFTGWITAFVWILVMGLLVNFFWRKGLRQYETVGH